MKVLVLLNEGAGTLAASESGDEPERIRRGFEAGGVEADVRVVAGKDLAGEVAAVREGRAGPFEAVVAGGGDGTLNTIAAALSDWARDEAHAPPGTVPRSAEPPGGANGGAVTAARARPAFGVLPLGTHNHFAKELGVPLKLDEAIPALAAGLKRRQFKDLDVGEVNGKIFLNFSSLGFHPDVVKHRDAQRDVLGRKKIWASLVALFKVLRRMPVMRVWLSYGDVRFRRITPSLIVCNNPHQMKVFGVENVSHPGRDQLNVYLARATRWYGVLWLILRAAFRRLETAKTFETLVLPEVTVERRRRNTRVSIDGEIVDLQTPLRYKVRRGGLRVLVPPPGQAQEAGEGGNLLGDLVKV